MIWDRYGYPGFKDYSVIRAYLGWFSINPVDPWSWSPVTDAL